MYMHTKKLRQFTGPNLYVQVYLHTYKQIYVVKFIIDVKVAKDSREKGRQIMTADLTVDTCWPTIV